MSQKRARLTHADRVLELLRCQRRPLSAYEILEVLRGEGVTAAMTVYRALARLLESGKIHRIESLNAWMACCEPHHQGTPIFEICDGCGNITEHVASHLAREIVALSADSGFVPDRPVIEIHGRCKECGETVSA